MQLLSTYNLTQLTKQPTHVKGNCLDLVITGVDCDETHVKNVEVDFSFCADHYPVTFTLQSLSTQNDSKLERVWFRNCQKMNTEKFCKDLKSSSLCNQTIYGNLSVDECVDLYNCTLEHLLNTHCLIVEKKKNQNLKKPKWFNDELMNLKRDKRRAERRLKKEFSKENK